MVALVKPVPYDFPNSASLAKQPSILDRFLETLASIIPENVVKVMADNDLLSVMTIGTVIGVLMKDTEENPSTIGKYDSPLVSWTNRLGSLTNLNILSLWL